MILTAIASAALMLMGPLCARSLLQILNTPASILDWCQEYLTILFLGALGGGLYNIMSGVLRGLGDSTSPLIYLIVSSVINIALDLLFVARMGMGIAGVAWATVIAQSVSAVLCILRIFRMKDTLDIRKEYFCINRRYIMPLVRLGLPSGVTQAITSMSAIIVQSLTNSFGEQFIAASTIVMRIDGFVILPALSFGTAMTTFSGQNIGAKLILSEIRENQDDRFQKIIDYVHMNFRDDLTLNAIAEKLFLSPSAATRLFRRYSNQSFPDYVKQIRLAYAKELLTGSVLPVSHIALESGFSTPSMFTQAFREANNITPTEYRRQHADPHKTEEDVIRRQALLLLKQDAETEDTSIEIISTDLCSIEPSRSWKSRVLNVGLCELLQSASMQRHILLLKDILNMEYIRICNIFSNNLMIFGKEKGSYNYSVLDEILDFCVDHKLKMFIDLAQRRNMNKSSGSSDIYSEEAETIFEDGAAWINAMDSLLKHLIHRYGMKEVKTWIFELSFFLNDRPYYKSDHYSTGMVWDLGYNLIRQNIPDVRIAGPGLLGLRESCTENLIDSF